MAPMEVAEASPNGTRCSSVESESTRTSNKAMMGDGQNRQLIPFQQNLQQEKALRAHAGAHMANYETTEQEIVAAFANKVKHLKRITDPKAEIDVAEVTRSLETLDDYFDILKSLGSGSVNQLRGCIEEYREISLSYREEAVLLKEQLFETKAELQNLEQSHTKRQHVVVGSPDSEAKDKKISELRLQQGLLKGEVQELKAGLNSSAKRNKDITKEIQERDRHIATLNTIREGLEGENTALTQRLEGGEKHATGLHESHEELQDSVRHLQSVIQHLEGELANYKESSSKASSRIDELSADVEATRKAERVAKSKNDTLYQRIRSLVAEKERLEKIKEGRKQMERTYQERVAHFQDENKRLLDEKKRLESNIQRAQNQIQQLNGHAQKQSKANDFALKNKSIEISELKQALEASDQAYKSEHARNENLQMQIFEVSDALKCSEAALTREKIQNTVTRGVHTSSVSADKVMKHVAREYGTSAIDENKSWLGQFVTEECNSKHDSAHAASDDFQLDTPGKIQELETRLEAEQRGKAETKTYIGHLEQQVEKIDELEKLIETMKGMDEDANTTVMEDFAAHDLPCANINGVPSVLEDSTKAPLAVVGGNGTASVSEEFISAPTSPCAPRSVATSAPTSASMSPDSMKVNATLTAVKEEPLNPILKKPIPGEESMADFERRHVPLPVTPQGHALSPDKREVANATFASMLGSFIRRSPNVSPRTSH